MSEHNILGAILAGGKSKRMGKDKLFLELNPNYYKEVENQVQNANFSEIQIKNDFMGKKRMLSAVKL